MRRDLRAHHACAKDRDLTYEKWRMACHDVSLNEAAAGEGLAG